MSKCSKCGDKGWLYPRRGSEEVAFCSCDKGKSHLQVLAEEVAENQWLRGQLRQLRQIRVLALDAGPSRFSNPLAAEPKKRKGPTCRVGGYAHV